MKEILIGGKEKEDPRACLEEKRVRKDKQEHRTR